MGPDVRDSTLRIAVQGLRAPIGTGVWRIRRSRHVTVKPGMPLFGRGAVALDYSLLVYIVPGFTDGANER